FLASAAGRRFGPGFSGWLTGLPLLAGPISIFVSIEQSPAFAAHAAGGTLLGMWSSCVFCLAYDRFARFGWPAAATAAVLGFAGATWALEPLALTPALALAGVYAGATLCLLAIERPTDTLAPVRLPAWDMPVRLAIAAAFVLLQTSIAGWLGPKLSGLVTPFPIVVILLTVFAHVQQGASAAARVLRGFLMGMYAFSAFFLIVAWMIESLGRTWAYLLALAACLAINGATLRVARRTL
ncbi:MAG TPA: hypothetical protein VLT59_05455, partial [Steroidobacteraceae bacterium]|nr:hypothetical protein [Steroidobacteraceae bacterium]